MHSIFKANIVPRLDIRINELKDRRKRLIKMAFKREGRLSDFEHGYKTLLARKNQIIKKYNTKELED